MAHHIDYDLLLKDKRVRAEIDRHLWIESEKCGCDIGFDKAQEDWIKRFSKAWMSYHMPEMMANNVKDAANGNGATRSGKKRRSAKSYMK